MSCPEITLACDSISATKTKLCIAGELRCVGSWFPDGVVYHDGHCYDSVNFETSPVTYGTEVDCGTCFRKVMIHTGSCFCVVGGSLVDITWSYLPDDGWVDGRPVAESSCAGGGCTEDVFTCAGSLFDIRRITYSEPYTTDQLKSDTIDALPAYSGYYDCDFPGDPEDGQGCDCSAVRVLSSDETSYSIRRFKYKFRFPDPGSGYLKILWNETFKPMLTGIVSYCDEDYDFPQDDPDPTHWTVTAKSEVIAGGFTESSVYTVSEPSSNGTTYITDIRWTNTEGCEPLPSSIEGVDQFADSGSTAYLCNDRDPANANCTCS